MNQAPYCCALLLSLIGAVASAAEKDREEVQTLGPVTVHGERMPLDSRRPDYDRMLPCIGCDVEINPVDGILLSVLASVFLPAEPVDMREFTPISMRQPRNSRADKLP